MQPVSGAYKPYADVRHIQAQATFELIDVDAASAAQSSGSQTEFFASLPQTHDKITGMTRSVATLEPEYWLLNGRFSSISEKGNNGETGYWSAVISDAQGNLDVQLIFEFAGAQSSDGFTIVFDDLTGECASEFTLTTYNASGGVIAAKSITGNTEFAKIVNMPSQNYRKVVLHCTKTSHPYRRIRIAEMVFGYLQYFLDDDISAMDVQYETTLDSQSQPSNCLTITINNTDRRYNIINPSGIYKYLQKGQGINASVYIDGERVMLGRFYFETSTSNDNSMTAQITAYDRFYAMDSSICNIGASGTWTVSEAVTAVLADSGLGITVNIPSSMASKTIGKAIPQNTSHREALRMIAQAAKSICYFDRLDVLNFVEPLKREVVDSMDDNNMSTFPTVSDTGLINAVEISVRDEYANSEEIKYRAENIAEDETERLLSITNPLVTDSTVAQWILDMAAYRIQYAIDERGNPARDIQDTIKIYDVYGENKDAVVLNETFTIGIGLTGAITAATNSGA